MNTRKLAAVLAFLIVLSVPIATCAAPSYLPNAYNGTVTLTYADYYALVLTAYYNNTGVMTDKLIKHSFWCVVGESSIDVVVDTMVSDSWKVYSSGGVFTASDREVRLAYQDAGDYIMKIVLEQFTGVTNQDVRIIFRIEGYLVGVYQGGIFALANN